MSESTTAGPWTTTGASATTGAWISPDGRAGPTTTGPDAPEATASGLREALAHGPVVLDGGLATQLERQGHGLGSALWSARLLADDPRAVEEAHAVYFAAGAQVATTASYQASLTGFARAGIDRSTAQTLIRRSVELAVRARSRAAVDHPTWVAGSVGPYGASLADGSEYRGDDGLSVGELRDWHRPRIALLIEAGVDALALETIPSAREVEALLAEVDGSGVDCWLSVTCGGTSTRAGDPAADVFALARGVDEVVAVGVNCTAPGDASALVGVAAVASAKPVVVYPNSGEVWDAGRRAWQGAAAFSGASVRGWVQDGARLVGGCCRVGPEEIAGIARELNA